MFRRGAIGEEETRLYSLGEFAARTSEKQRAVEEGQAHGFTLDRAAGIIDDLPPDIPRESAVRIVRRTLEAAGIKVEDLERSTRAQEAKLGSEIEFSRNRQEELRQRTEEVEHSLEEEIRKAREARDTGVAEEAENIARASTEREEVRRVRAFFGFPKDAGEEGAEAAPDPSAPVEGPKVTGPIVSDETQILSPYDLEGLEDLEESAGWGTRRRSGPFADREGETGQDQESTIESGPPYGPPGATEDR